MEGKWRREQSNEDRRGCYLVATWAPQSDNALSVGNNDVFTEGGWRARQNKTTNIYLIEIPL
jgi:hypothetical protein